VKESPARVKDACAETEASMTKALGKSRTDVLIQFSFRLNINESVRELQGALSVWARTV
jgi:hypothetical protein